MAQDNILIIKLGALGDFIQALGPMAAIRRAHPGAHVTLLTTKPFVELAQRSGYVDKIWVDDRPGWGNLAGWWRLRQRLIEGNFTRVYDLQNNDRTNVYFKLYPRAKRPEWVGTAKGASHCNASPARTAGHAFDGHVQTLGLAGIEDIEIDDLSWLDEAVAGHVPDHPYALLVPGSAPQHPQKRWPVDSYGVLAQKLRADGLIPVILGTKSESDLAAEIKNICPAAIDLTGQTTLLQLPALARGAAKAIGNDTGPMHLIAATGCPSFVLFSGASKPHRHAPKSRAVKTLQRDRLEDLSVDEVLAAL